MTEELVLQRTEENKPVAIKPSKRESLSERVNEICESIAKRAYELFDGNGRKFGHDLDDWFRAETELLRPVHLRITESGENVEVKAEVPGFNEKEIEISVEPRRLTITGKRENNKEQKRGKTVYSEGSCEQMLRIVELPATVDADKATATLKNGLLELMMPKAVKNKTIGIKPKAA
jgi:HSP20 family protein